MRIIAGKHKGKKLFGFDGDSVRPTADKAREAIFAILGNINGKKFLDVCCGSGAMGLEAESRGARVTLVDKDENSVALSRKNANSISSGAVIVKKDAISFLENTCEKFDYIFMDPPYAISLCGQAVKVISERDLLTSDGIFIYERDVKEDNSYKSIQKYDERRYGKGVFAFYRKENE